MTEKFLKTQNDITDTIFLVDQTITVEKIKEIFPSSSKIISLDYESHKTLKLNDIPHYISDNYISTNFIDEIQNESYRFSKWYEHFEKLIQFHQINLGKLFYVEFNYFLIPILKKFAELIKICEKYPKSKFLVSRLTSKTLQNLSNYVHIISDDDHDNSFLYEKIHFNLTDSIGFDISRSQYQLMKQLSEKFLEKIVRSKNDVEKKSIIFAEFDPIKFESVFNSPREFDLILYNRRRPSIWNKKTFEIIRKSNCILPPFNKIQKKIQEKILSEQKIFSTQINLLFKKENFFQKYFSIADHSFWYIIKDEFKKLCENRFLEAIQEILITETILESSKPSAIVLWSESGFNEQILLNISKKQKIKTILIQHGLYIDDALADTYYDFTGIFPKKSDKFLVWGDVTKKHAITMGVPEEKISILGNPQYDNFTLDGSSDDDYILLATTSPRKIFVPGYGVSENDFYEKLLTEISIISKKLGKKLIIKLHPFQDESDIQKIILKLDSDIVIIKNGSIIPLLKKCSLLIAVGVSSSLIESQLLGKPAISIPVSWDRGIPNIVRNQTCYMSSIENLEKTIKSIDKNPPKSKNLEENIANYGKSTQIFLSYLNSIKNQ